MPAIRNLYTLIAREVSVDSNDKMSSIIKIIDKFTFSYNPKKMKEQGVTLGEKPILFDAKYAVTTSWFFGEQLKKDTVLVFKISVSGPGGQDFGGPSKENLVPAGFDRMNMNFNTTGLPVTKAGKYTLKAQVLSKGGKKLAEGEYPFVVELIEE